MVSAAIIVYIVLHVLLGLRFGFFRRLVDILGFFVGLFLGKYVSPLLAGYFGINSSHQPAANHFWLYLGIVAFVVIAFELLAAGYAGVLDFMRGLGLDRALGAVSGAVIAVLQVSTLIYLFGLMTSAPVPSGAGQQQLVVSVQDSLKGSWVAKRIDPLETFTRTIFLPALPADASYFSQTYTSS